ncbi:MAG: SocA family protein [Alphaproteobacteria bacterium]|nr:SocA family protein [Alphaproteobacteria bacterium]
MLLMSISGSGRHPVMNGRGAHMADPKISLDWAKFVAMVHYVCNSVSDDPTKLGAVKLQKILWNSDREAYLRLGHPISGAGYVKMQRGPAAPKLNDALAELEANGRLVTSDIPRGPHRQKLFLSMRAADPSVFSQDELAIIDHWIRKILPKTAAKASDDSHDLTWEIYELGETIRYESAFVSSEGEADPDQLQEAKLAIMKADAAGGAW